MTLSLLDLLKINKSLLPIKIHYFLVFTALGCGMPFRTVYAKQLGISGSATGLAFAIISMCRMVTNPLFGVFLDKSKKFRLTLVLTTVMVAASHFAMTLVPPVLDHSPRARVNVSCNGEVLKVQLVDVNQDGCHHAEENTTCTMNCSVVAVSTGHDVQLPDCSQYSLKINFTGYKTSSEFQEEYLAEPSANFVDVCKVNSNSTRESCCGMMDCSTQPSYESDSFLSTQFWSFLFLMFVSSACISASIFIVDTVCYEILGSERERYGAQRVYGTMGWGVGALVGGYFNQLFTGYAFNTDYSPGFYLLAGLCLLDTIPLCFVDVQDVKYSPNVWKDAKLLLSQPFTLAYITMVLFIGILSGLIWNYQFWFLEEIGSSQLLLGLSQTVECFAAELPCFLIAGWLIKKIGHVNCNNLTFLFIGLRYICFYYMYDPWWSLAAAMFHGPTFGFFYASMTSFAKEKAPKGTEATAQATLSATFESLGVALGSVFGGIGFDILGSRPTLLYSAIASFVLLLCNIVLQYLIPENQNPDGNCDKTPADRANHQVPPHEHSCKESVSTKL